MNGSEKKMEAKKYIKWTKDEIKTLKKVYKTTQVKDLLNTFPGRTQSQLEYKVHSLGLTKGRGANKRYNINEKFFDKFTPESSYWLGFILADGCVEIPSMYSNTGSYKLSINLKASDKSHLEKLQSKLSNTPVRYTKQTNSYRYVVCSKKIVTRLIKLGIKPRKSLTNQFPKNIPKKYLRDVIRGYIDGNGCLFVCKQRQSTHFDKLRIQISGTKHILDMINKHIKDEFGFVLGNVHKVGSICSVQTEQYNRINKICEWLYYPKSVSLSRKVDIWTNYKIYDKFEHVLENLSYINTTLKEVYIQQQNKQPLRMNVPTYNIVGDMSKIISPQL